MFYKSLLVLIYCLHTIAGNEVRVNTTSGVVRGHTLQVLGQTVEEYLGIPYAEPPVGELRFAKTKPLEKPLSGEIDATKTGKSCYQLPLTPVSTISEDCLVLNVWTQSSNTTSHSKLKPVMFFIHGGAFIVGSIFSAMIINGSVLVEKDVVMVAINYRLGYFGFLYGGVESAPGNAGLYDQVMALKWVRDNIHRFGGDKDQITIFGQSAGSMSVSVHLLSPLSKGLFKRAILFSGAMNFNKNVSISDTTDALSKAKLFAKSVNCSDDKTWLECLRKLPPQQIVQASLPSTGIVPTEGTEIFPLRAQKAFEEKKFNSDVDVIAGVTKDEGTSLAGPLFDPTISTRTDFTLQYWNSFLLRIKAFTKELDIKKVTDFFLKNVEPTDSDAIKEKIFELVSDVVIKCPTYVFAKRFAQQSGHKSKVFFYELTYRAHNDSIMAGVVPPNTPGVYHCADLPFTFGKVLLHPEMATQTDMKFGKQFINWWTNFAKYGKPDNSWRPLLTGINSLPAVVKDLNPESDNKYFNNLFSDTCEGFWKDYF